MEKKKTYVLDTNVLLHDPTAILAFESNDVVIPVYVIEEVDNFKKQQDELGRNARTVSREIDAYRAKGSLSHGVKLESGGSLRVLFASDNIPVELRSNHQKDDLILAVAFSVMKREPDRDTVFVTMDTNLRIRADALRVTTQDYEKGKARANELYTGQEEINVSGEALEALHQDGRIPLLEGFELTSNQFLTLREEGNPGHFLLGKVSSAGDAIVSVKNYRKPIWGITPRNKEQIFAMNLLLDPDVKLVTLSGKAGTGKTLVAVACGLHQVTDEPRFDKLLVSRPVFPMGKDIGFLPGTIEEKLNPWMQPIHDSIEFLLSANRKDRDKPQPYGGLKDMGILQIEPLTYIRGRSIPNQFLIIDESQNLTPHEVKTILTRAGEHTKIVLTGDPYQIDNPYLDSLSNGLSYTVEKFRGVPLAGTVTLEKGERSQLAELAANLL